MLYFYSIFISIYAESFRRTAIKQGYPEDHDIGKWTINDYCDYITFKLKKDENKNKD
jgi:hypothetical protein